MPLKDVQKMYLRHDSSGTSPAWYVDKVVVSQKTPSGSHERSLIFICNKWISSSGEEFVPMSQISSSISSSTPSADALKRDLLSSEERLLFPPSASFMPSPPSEAYENPPSSPDRPLPPPPSDDANGFPQLPSLQDFANDIPSSFPESLPPMPQSDEEEGIIFSFTELLNVRNICFKLSGVLIPSDTNLA